MIAIIFRRLRKGKSPFRPDRFICSSFNGSRRFNSSPSISGTTFLLRFGAGFGILGEVYYINEWVMFSLFIGLFFMYVYSITRAWRITRWVRRGALSCLRKQKAQS